MQFKKLAAIAGSALMAGLSLAAPVLATSVTQLKNIGTLAGATDTAYNFPIFVIGARAATSDVAGAVDIAVNLASKVVKTSSVLIPGQAAGVSGGVSMATPTNPITMWDNFGSSKQVLTSNDLPDILTSGSYVDANSIAYPYSQYLTFASHPDKGQIVYDTPNGGTAPALGMRFTGNNEVYTYQLAFTKQLSEAIGTTGSVANLINTQLNMLGKTWTITGAQVNAIKDLALTMLSGKNSQTVTTETAATYTIGSNTYTVSLVAVGEIGGLDAATITVSGGNLAGAETLQILSGGTKSLSDGTLVGVTSIFKTTKTGAIDSATVFVGADKLEIEDMDMTDGGYYAGVKINGQSLTDVTVSMSGNSTGIASGAVTLNTLKVVWKPTLEQFVTSGNSLSDPFTNGAFKLFFGGISPALDDSASRETLTITPSGTTATMTFKAADGSSLSQNFVKATALGLQKLSLQDAGGYEIYVVEGVSVGQNKYAVLGQNYLAGNGQNPFGHIIRVLSLQSSPTSTSQFQDIASGTTIQVTGGNTSMFLDGQEYKVCVIGTATLSAAFTWGTGAGSCSYGNEIDVFPSIQTSKGAWVAITNYVTVPNVTATPTINLPTGQLAVTLGMSGYQAVGKAKFYTTQASGAITLNASDNAQVGTASGFATPGVMFVEGLDESQARHVIALRLDSGATYTRVELPNQPVFSSAKTNNSGVSGTTINKYVDIFGTFVTYDQTAPGTFSLSYPASQAQATVGVGKSPAASGGGVGGTVTTQTVLPITTDIVKLDSEVSDKTANDFVILGGPCINTLVDELATAGKFPYTCANWPGRNFGRVQLIADAFATGKTALVVAGTRAEDTDLAAQMVQNGFNGASDTIKSGSSTEITGTVQSPAYS